MLTAASVVLVFAFFGAWMLARVFRVDTAAFQIAGGILVFAVAARGLLGAAEAHTSLTSDDLAVFPMGFPFLAGPGTIVTTILLMQREGPWCTAAAAIGVYAVTCPILHLAPLLERSLGKVGIAVVARILYIFISAKAVAFVLEGLRAHGLGA